MKGLINTGSPPPVCSLQTPPAANRVWKTRRVLFLFDASFKSAQGNDGTASGLFKDA